MRTRSVLMGVAAALLMSSMSAIGADAPDAAAKEVTLKGTMLCGKCELHETAKCQNVLKVTEGDKSTLYYMADNALSKEKHPEVCMAPKENVTVTGTVEVKDGKNQLTASKIELPAK